VITPRVTIVITADMLDESGMLVAFKANRDIEFASRHDGSRRAQLRRAQRLLRATLSK
jgi:hypothetical protein